MLKKLKCVDIIFLEFILMFNHIFVIFVFLLIIIIIDRYIYI